MKNFGVEDDFVKNFLNTETHSILSRNIDVLKKKEGAECLSLLCN